MRVWLAILAVTALQTTSATDLVRLARPLRPAEVDVVLEATRRALDGKTFTVTFPGRDDGPELLMGADGRPRLVRVRVQMQGGIVGGVIPGGPPPPMVTYHVDATDLVDFTGLAARRCDGAPVQGGLVITYERDNETGKWTVTAGTTPAVRFGFLMPYADLLEGRVHASSGVPDEFSRNLERGISAPFSAPRTTFGLGDHPEGATQTLWIDVDSFLPVRWEVSVRGEVTYTRVFKYKPIDLRAPDGVLPPTCIP